MNNIQKWLTPVKLVALLSFCAVLLWSYLTTLPDGRLHVYVCDVGQGDALVLKTPAGSDVVIDGGPDNEMLPCLASSMPFFDRTIELMILTHPHQDHMVGLSEVFRRYRVQEVLLPPSRFSSAEARTFMNLLAEEGARHYIVRAGDEVVADGAHFVILWPPGNVSGFSEDDLNEQSIVMRLTYGNFHALLTGDKRLDLTGEWGNTITFLKVPHHGSRTGVEDTVLGALSPQLSVISVGTDNRYGHPHPELLERFRRLNLPLLRTDTDGTIQIVTDGLRWEVERKPRR